MKVKVVGIKSVSFDTDKGHTEGKKFYCTFSPDDKRNFEGVCADSFYCDLMYSPFGVPDSIKIGDTVDLVYSRTGLGANAKDRLVQILDEKGKPVHCITKNSYNAESNAPNFF